VGKMRWEKQKGKDKPLFAGKIREKKYGPWRKARVGRRGLFGKGTPKRGLGLAEREGCKKNPLPGEDNLGLREVLQKRFAKKNRREKGSDSGWTFLLKGREKECRKSGQKIRNRRFPSGSGYDRGESGGGWCCSQMGKT